MKKLISILLAVMLVVSGMSLSTFAADEAYSFDFDTGFVRGSGSSYYDTYITGSDYELFNTATEIYIKGWCYTASGIAEFQYNVANTGWVTMPADGFSDRSDVYEHLAQDFTNLGIEFAPNEATSGFEYRIPLEGITIPDGINDFDVKIITNNGVEITLVDITFNCCDPYISDEPVDIDSYSNTHLSLDEYRTYRDGAMTQNVAASTTIGVSFAAGNAHEAGMYGWVSCADEIESYGYSVDGGEIVLDDTFLDPAVEELTPYAPYTYFSRFEIKVPTADWTVGEYSVTGYCKLVNGTYLIIDTMVMVVTDPNAEVIPSVDFDSVTGFMGDSICTFDYDWYTDGMNLSCMSSDLAPNPHYFRKVWAPRPVSTGSATLKVDAETNNKYALFNSYFSYYSDYRWNGGYTFYADLAVNTADGTSENTRGMHLNFSHEGYSGDIVPLYEKFVNVDGLDVTGTSGVVVSLTAADLLQIAVLTYDPTTATKGAVVGSITLTGDLVLDSLKTVAAVDNGTDAIFILIEGTLVAKISYSNAAAFGDPELPYREGYYRTATVMSADGTVIAETNEALISKYKTVGLGTRNKPMLVDNISLAAAIEVNDTTVEVVPTDIELAADSIYKIDATNGIIIAKASVLGGENYAAFMSNFTTSKYMQLVNSSGNVVTSAARLNSKYTVNLVDGDGVVTKTYSLALLGDITGDGRINSTDGTKLTANSSGYVSGTVAFAVANINIDRRVNAVDATQLQKVLQAGKYS